MQDEKLLEHLCNLSKLTLTEEEVKSFSSDMDVIIGIMDSIKEVEMTGDIHRDKGVYFSELREDQAQPSYPTEKLLANAKEQEDNYYAVPKLF